MKICMIVCYFGPLPRYFDLFFSSCLYNRNIDFIFFTDQKIPDQNHSNIKVNRITLKDLTELIKKKLDLDLEITNPYKLCDLKPAYGLIFEEFIKEYMFWSTGDIDLILGNTRKFLTNEILDNYDIISFRKEYISGFFFLFRNEERINRLFEKNIDYKNVFKSEKHYCFDECNFSYDVLFNGGSILDIETEIKSMTEIVQYEASQNNLRIFFETLAAENPGRYYFNNGSIRCLDTRKEHVLLHFVRFKNHVRFIFPAWRKVPNAFVVTEIGIYERNNLFKLRGMLYDIRVKVQILLKYMRFYLIVNFGSYYSRLLKLRIANAEKYRGFFQLEDDILEIASTKRSLFIINNGRQMKLMPLTRSYFIMESAQVLVKFSFNSKGEIASMLSVDKNMEKQCAMVLKSF